MDPVEIGEKYPHLAPAMKKAKEVFDEPLKSNFVNDDKEVLATYAKSGGFPYNRLAAYLLEYPDIDKICTKPV